MRFFNEGGVCRTDWIRSFLLLLQSCTSSTKSTRFHLGNKAKNEKGREKIQKLNEIKLREENDRTQVKAF